MTKRGRPPSCFTRGTHLAVARGETLVEAIKVGDAIVVLRDGLAGLEPVKWVGVSSVPLARHGRPGLPPPVRIRMGALAENQPTQDLFLSPDHCLIISGLCVPARLLVNGGSIVEERSCRSVTYYHIELERHGILLAESALAESYLDTGNRSVFDNAGEPRQLHPPLGAKLDADRWLTDACAPLVRVSDQLEPIWRRLADRSEQLGFAVPAVGSVADPDVHLLADGQRISPALVCDSCHVFAVPAGVRSVSLASRACIPADRMGASLLDQRRLGVSVTWIAIQSDSGETLLMPDHPALRDGWNDFEQSGTALWRWTEGLAAIPWEAVAGAATVTIRCTPVDQYPTFTEPVAWVA